MWYVEFYFEGRGTIGEQVFIRNRQPSNRMPKSCKREYAMMVVVVDNVTAKNEEGSEEVVRKAAKAIERACSGGFPVIEGFRRRLRVLLQHSEDHQQRIGPC